MKHLSFETDRLEALKALVGHCASAADIGCDHGIVACDLLKEERVERVIAADISEKCLDKARQRARLMGVHANLEARVGNGLSVLKPAEVDTVIIAGMGGTLIMDILQSNLLHTKSFRRFILQPMNAVVELRRWLAENGFVLFCDRLVLEKGTFYTILSAGKGRGATDDPEFPETLIRDNPELWKRYVDEKIRLYRKVLADLPDGTSPGLLKARIRYEKTLQRWEDRR